MLPVSNRVGGSSLADTSPCGYNRRSLDSYGSHRMSKPINRNLPIRLLILSCGLHRGLGNQSTFAETRMQDGPRPSGRQIDPPAFDEVVAPPPDRGCAGGGVRILFLHRTQD
jgi:hypothetical protein